ncbi:RING/U-BOX SUPERFAMILY PROTEIN [Salix koriyanagi]|uniref:RING/U-BOX SUPERFAMILY PROTEIN n=1 Tax=Salix koriyanagi TaxID=2511006 RepID=A0A9Q0UD63_9ROSI|nr:RING/U-BOX SUPERFAMILY PROTEIN [Salix koriyanagi]
MYTSPCKLAILIEFWPELVLNFTGGALVGSIIGAIEGQTTETGFLRGSGVGAITGAVTSVQLLESMIDGEPLSKVAFVAKLVEWQGILGMGWPCITDSLSMPSK